MMLKPVKDSPLISIREYSCVVFIILFLSVSVVFIGISCDEQSEPLVSTTQSTQLDTELEQTHQDTMKFSGGDRKRNAILMKISRSIDRLTDAIKEHECLSN